MNILNTLTAVPDYESNTSYNKGDVVVDNFVDFVCVKDGTMGIEPFARNVGSGDGTNWKVYAPGRIYGDLAYFYFQVAPFGWIYFKDYINGKQDIATLSDLDLKDRIIQLETIPGLNPWFDHSQGMHFNSLLANSVNMGTADGTKLAAVEEDTLQNITGLLRSSPAAFRDDQTGVFKESSPVKMKNNFLENISEEYYWDVSFDASRVARTSDETKPKNVRGFKAIYLGAKL